MKTLRYLGICASVLALAACSKNVTPEIVCPNPDPSTPSTLTFTVSIDDNATRASLSGLSIQWSSGDCIGVATDNDATIKAYTLTPDSENPGKASVTINTVEGATTYYAIYTGSSDFSSISFDTSSLTFSGMRIEHEFLSANGLTMAGKLSDEKLVMKPCLAILKFRIAASSVEAKYATVGEHSFSGVRGFNLFLRTGDSRKQVGGIYTVSFSGDDFTVAGSNSSQQWYKQINAGTDMFSSETDYYAAVIPVGSINNFRLEFFGFDESKEPTWTTQYSMTRYQSTSVDPGDFYDLGTLDPVGLKKVSESSLISIDGSFDDWADVSATLTLTGEALSEFKAVSDGKYIWFYQKFNHDVINLTSQNNYIRLMIDADNDSSTGGNEWFAPGADVSWQYFFSSSSDAAPMKNYSHSFCQVYDSSWTAKSDFYSQMVKYAASTDSEGNICVEIGTPLENLGLTAGSTVKVGFLGYTPEFHTGGSMLTVEIPVAE